MRYVPIEEYCEIVQTTDSYVCTECSFQTNIRMDVLIGESKWRISLIIYVVTVHIGHFRVYHSL